MSSMSAQGVVERASAELSKRINGLGLRSGKHHSHGTSGKTSVMERVTNVFCGAPEKPSRLTGRATRGTPQPVRKAHVQHVQPMPQPQTVAWTSWEQLLLDERYLGRLFMYFTSAERKTLAQVCSRWRDVLYRSPGYWSGLVPVLQCRELRQSAAPERARLYASLLRRGFRAVCLMGAADEDALDMVHSFPLASKHVHSLSLRCSSISDRGLEALLDHLQVCRIKFCIKHTFQ